MKTDISTVLAVLRRHGVQEAQIPIIAKELEEAIKEEAAAAPPKVAPPTYRPVSVIMDSAGVLIPSLAERLSIMQIHVLDDKDPNTVIPEVMRAAVAYNEGRRVTKLETLGDALVNLSGKALKDMGIKIPYRDVSWPLHTPNLSVAANQPATMEE